MSQRTATGKLYTSIKEQCQLLTIIIAVAFTLSLTACDDDDGDDAPKAGDTITSGTGIQMVWIPAGTFIMGSPDTEPNREPWGSDTETQHSVTLSNGFYMGKYEVTQAQWEAVMGAGTNPSLYITTKDGEDGANLPVECVTWFDAIEFCNKLSEEENLQAVYTITGRTPSTGYPITNATVTANFTKNGYRLPTEAQWEYAARGSYANKATEKNTKPFGIGNGNQMLSGMANFDTRYTYDATDGGHKDVGSTNATHHVGQTSEVGKYTANNYGLHDMHGNVWEWCWDWYDYYTSVAKTDPTGADSGSSRLVRGGSWFSSGQYLRSVIRYFGDPGNRGYGLGFRLVRP